MSSRCEVAQVRSLLTDLVDHVKIKRDISLMGDCKKVECRVGGASEGHIGCQSVLECSRCDDVARTNIVS